MAELRYVRAATYSPTTCSLCATHEGPFVDTGVEFIGHGHVYICASHSSRSGCVKQMARLDAMMDEEVVGEAMTQLDEARAEIARLTRELNETRVVPLADVLEYLEQTAPASVGGEE